MKVHHDLSICGSYPNLSNSEKHVFSEKKLTMRPLEFQQSSAIVAPSEQHSGLHGFAVSNGCSEKQLSDCDFRLRDKKGV